MLNFQKLKDLRQNFGFLREVESIQDYNAFENMIFHIDRCLRFVVRPKLLFNKQPLVFGVGLSKTGTTSLSDALNILNYSSSHWSYPMAILRYQDGKLLVNCNKLLVHFNSYSDLPVCRVYKLLDSAFPNSKFILTVREEESWFKSYYKNQMIVNSSWYKNNTPGQIKYLLDDMYGSVIPEKETNIAKYRQYNEGVQQYFKNRPNDLLVMNITAGDGWEKLCPFLGLNVPNQPFPTSNTYIGKKLEITN